MAHATAFDTGPDGAALLLPDRAARVAADAHGLTRALAHLAWPERARVLDGFFWQEACRRLTSEAVTAVVNRRRAAAPGSRALEGYLAHCREVAAAVLVPLGEPPPALPQGLVAWYVSADDAQHGHAAACLAAGDLAAGDLAAGCRPGGVPELCRILAALPGFAFLLLAMHDSDSAMSFTARDAFREALLGSP